MAARIRILDSGTASKIAAGEVVERPASVVKELIENSLDAGATSVSVHVEEGGRRLIRVTDNGSGISEADAPLVVARHATSKISAEEDLLRIKSFGFRGEALASIGAVSRLVIRTKEKGAISGVAVIAEGGSQPVVKPEGCPEGTSVEVRDLFFNTPVRRKFMRSARTELGRLTEVFRKVALINPAVRFILVSTRKTSIDLPAGSLLSRIEDIFGRENTRGLVEVKGPMMRGFIAPPHVNYPASRALHTYVNSRPVTDRTINRAVMDGFGRLLESGRYPFAVIDILIPPGDVDVNVHPAKAEVRFKSPGAVYELVRGSIERTLSRGAAGVFTGAARGAAPGAPASFMERGAAYVPNVSSGEPALTVPLRESRDIINPEFLDLEFIGQIWGEFLLAQSRAEEGKFYIIDQHGAAERAAFEELKREFYSGCVASQMLLLPERVDTGPDEKEALLGATDLLARLGFIVEPFGPSAARGGETFLVKGVPRILGTRGAARIVKDLSMEIASSGGSRAPEAAIENILMTVACHSVIRGPRRLGHSEARGLFERLALIDFAGHCPHGRPVIKVITRREIEKIFDR